MILNFLHRLTLIGINSKLSIEQKTKLTNINRLIIFMILIAIINFFYDLTIEQLFYSTIDLIISITLLFFLFLNHNGYYALVTNGIMFFLNAIIFILSLIAGKETLFFLYFFPIMILSFFLFGIREKRTLAFYILLPIVLLITTVSNDYTFFSDILVSSPKNVKFISWSNLVNVILFTGYGLFNITNLYSETERNLLTKKANLNAVFHNSLLYIILLDKSMKIKAFNKLAKDFFYKINTTEIQSGEYILNFIPTSEHRKFIRNFKLATEGKVIKAEKKIYFSHQARWFEIHFNPTYDENNFIDGIIFSTIDITDYKKSEFNIKKERRKAEMANMIKANFLSSISHELRTPLNAMIGLSNALLNQNPREDQIENLKILKYSVESLLTIINDILDFNEIDSGKIEFAEVEFNLKQLSERISNFLTHLIYEKPINFVISYDEKIPSVLQGDPVRLSQILTNLISNALKFTKQGKVSLEMELEELQPDFVNICFSITDTGIGISEDKIDFIFERFDQGIDMVRKLGSTGLGLAITIRLLEFQNSTLFVESELGKGSKFYFCIKFKYKADNNHNSDVESELKVPEDNRLQGIRVLLVEDYAINQIVAGEFLSKWGIEFEIAENGIDALEKLKTKQYEIILMDLQMPLMDGYETSKKIRSMENLGAKRITIIALTASNVSDVQEKIISAGMDDSISKPFNPNELFQKILKYKEKKNE